jgi:pyruvate dehydrogenase E2 component (dihydrolipoamide acetyltransferase)
VIATESERIKASPLARKIAEQRNVDLRQVRGSGPNGRIIRKDVEQAPLAAGSAAPAIERLREAPAERPAPAGTPASGGRLVPFTRMRETIARRMQESVTQAPHFYTTTSVNMREAVRLREHLKGMPEYKGLSINHLVIKAAAYGIKNEPRVNRCVRDNQVFEPDHINIGVITAIEDGLLIPVIRDADALPLKDLAFEARAAIERARAGRPSAADLTGGTFSISNMGMFDIENFTAIINPGQGSVLAVSSIREEPVVEHGAVVPGLRMKVTISVDHRIIDGVMAGTFLKFFKEALEMPALLMN